MKTLVYVQVAEQIEEQDMLGSKTFFPSWTKPFHRFRFDWKCASGELLVCALSQRNTPLYKLSATLNKKLSVHVLNASAS